MTACSGFRSLLAVGLLAATLARGQEALVEEPPVPPVDEPPLMPPVPEGSIVLEPLEPSEVGHLPLCHPASVRRGCEQLSGEENAESVSFARLTSKVLLASGDSAQGLWSALGLSAAGASVNCSDLCNAIVAYVGGGAGVLPPASDFACYTVAGVTLCDLDVSPTRLLEEIGRGSRDRDEPPPQDAVRFQPDPKQPSPAEGELVAHSIIAETGVARSADAKAQAGAGRLRGSMAAQSLGPMPAFSLWQMVERLAHAFRIFPSSGQDLPLSMATAQANEADADTQALIARSSAQAKAWMSTVLNEMAGGTTGSFLTEWFGGQGSLSPDAVSEFILRTMTFVNRELMDGIHFVYPADDTASSYCKQNVVAYVWKYPPPSGVSGYYETQGPQCSPTDDPAVKQCGVDTQGRYFVYLCRYWKTGLGASDEVSTFVHEASHHAGALDITYDKDQMKRNSQQQQLDNAANYQNYARSVVESAWGCADSAVVTNLPFSCQGQPCTCGPFATMCAGSPYSAQIQAQCPSTCGRCSQAGAPAPAPRAVPTPSPTTAPSPAPQTPVGCTDSPGTFSVITSSGQRMSSQCPSFVYYGYCTEPDVARMCPAGCGRCAAGGAPQPAPTPAPPAPAALPQAPGGCIDSAGTFSVTTSSGQRMSSQCPSFVYYGYCTEPDVARMCPAGCGSCGAAGPPQPTSTPAPTPAPAPSGCMDSVGKVTVTVSSGNRMTSDCYAFGYYGYCTETEVGRMCPKTCNQCR